MKIKKYPGKVVTAETDVKWFENDGTHSRSQLYEANWLDAQASLTSSTTSSATTSTWTSMVDVRSTSQHSESSLSSSSDEYQSEQLDSPKANYVKRQLSQPQNISPPVDQKRQLRRYHSDRYQTLISKKREDTFSRTSSSSGSRGYLTSEEEYSSRAFSDSSLSSEASEDVTKSLPRQRKKSLDMKYICYDSMPVVCTSDNVIVEQPKSMNNELIRNTVKVNNNNNNNNVVKLIENSCDDNDNSNDKDFIIPRPKLIVPVHTYGIRKRRTGNLSVRTESQCSGAVLNINNNASDLFNNNGTAANLDSRGLFFYFFEKKLYDVFALVGTPVWEI